jgi:Enoyl-(Acyl carrier protein) reductase
VPDNARLRSLASPRLLTFRRGVQAIASCFNASRATIRREPALRAIPLAIAPSRGRSGGSSTNRKPQTCGTAERTLGDRKMRRTQSGDAESDPKGAGWVIASRKAITMGEAHVPGGRALRFIVAALLACRLLRATRREGELHYGMSNLSMPGRPASNTFFERWDRAPKLRGAPGSHAHERGPKAERSPGEPRAPAMDTRGSSFAVCLGAIRWAAGHADGCPLKRDERRRRSSLVARRLMVHRNGPASRDGAPGRSTAARLEEPGYGGRTGRHRPAVERDACPELAMQMLAQKTGGNIVTITAALARNPIRGVTASVPMITKGGLETITRQLAMEYAKEGIRVNAVAPGAVYTSLHDETAQDVMESLSPMGRPSTVRDVTDAVMYLTDAATVTGDILEVDGGAHSGSW